MAGVATALAVVPSYMLAQHCGVFERRLDSYTWERSALVPGSAPRVAIEALMAIRDGAPAARWCDTIAPPDECDDAVTWHELVVEPVRADAPSCLASDESASFRYGGAIANPNGTTSMWIECDARREELKITTKISKARGKGEANHVVVAMEWVEPLSNIDSRK